MYSNRLVCDILLYIDNNIQNKITIEDLEHQFCYNRYYIMKLFKKEMELTVIEYINSIRIYHATVLLKEYSYTLTSIAFKVGFYSLEYFSETFKHITKLNPRVFQYYFSNKNISNEEVNIIRNSIVY